MSLALGKARFLVAKLHELRTSNYKVRTQTAILGVRGSDFVVTAMPKVTEVTTLEETRLEVVSLAAPEARPTLLEDFQRTTVEMGALPSIPERVAPAVIEQLRRDFTISPDRVRPEAKIETREKKEPAARAGAPPEQKGVLVPTQELVKPQAPRCPRPYRHPRCPRSSRSNRPSIKNRLSANSSRSFCRKDMRLQ